MRRLAILLYAFLTRPGGGRRSAPPGSMFGRIRQLIVAFFVYNVVNVVISFHVFVDVANFVSTHGLHAKLSGYERAAAAFLFFDFLLSVSACLFGIKALDEVRQMHVILFDA